MTNIKEQKQKYYLANRGKILAKVKAYQALNKEKFKEYNRECRRNYYLNNCEKLKKYQREYRKNKK